MNYIASAYPNSALPALSLMAIALVATGTLAAWLALVFIAAREPRTPTAQLSREPKGALVPGPRSEELTASDEGRHRVAAPGGERENRAA
jgi:hypothetical protein